jgi:hypothetical protein
VLADLLPPEVLQQFLDIWLYTGTNLLYTKALETLIDFEEAPDYHKVVFESMESEMADAMHAVRAKWNAEFLAAEAAMERGAES